MKRIIPWVAAVAVALPALAWAEKGTPFKTEEEERVYLGASIPAQPTDPLTVGPSAFMKDQFVQHEYVMKDGKLVMSPNCPYTIANQKYEQALAERKRG